MMMMGGRTAAVAATAAISLSLSCSLSKYINTCKLPSSRPHHHRQKRERARARKPRVNEICQESSWNVFWQKYDSPQVTFNIKTNVLILFQETNRWASRFLWPKNKDIVALFRRRQSHHLVFSSLSTRLSPILSLSINRSIDRCNHRGTISKETDRGVIRKWELKDIVYLPVYNS